MKRPNGIIEPPFAPVARALRNQVRRSGGGAAVCVYFRGRPVVDAWAGTRDEIGTPWESDTMAMSFSTTKGVTSTALHLLVDRGAVDYDDPVARYWPEFARHGKERITIRQVLSHQAGLHDIRNLIDRGERMLDWDFMVQALENARPAFEPGTRVAYHGLTFGWLVGELVRRVGGMPLSEFVRREIAAPLGLEGLWVGTPPEVQQKAAVLPRPMAPVHRPERFRIPGRLVGVASRLVGYPVDLGYLRDALMPKDGGLVFWHPRVLDVPIPAGNGLFTARSLARLYAVLAAGGALDGTRLLSAETVRRATTVQTRRRDRVLVFRPHWRLGYHGVLTTRGGVPGAFGHFGFGGSGAWGCARRQLAVAMVNNRAGGTPLGDLRILQISAVAVRCADRLLRTGTAEPERGTPIDEPEDTSRRVLPLRGRAS